MDDIVLTFRINETRSIRIAPLPRKTYHEAGAKGLGGEYGYFIYEFDEGQPDLGIDVIGKAASLDAAMRLYDIICGTARS